MNSWTQTLLLVLLWFNILAESLSTHHSTLIRPLYGVGLASIQMEPSAESTRLNTSFHPTFEGRLVLQRLIEEILLEYKSSSDQCISREFKFPTANDQPFCPANKYNIWVSRNNSLDASQLWQATREIFNTKILENYCTKAALDRIDTKENRAKIITTSPGDSLITPILPTPTPAPTDLNLGASFKGSIQTMKRTQIIGTSIGCSCVGLIATYALVLNYRRKHLPAAEVLVEERNEQMVPETNVC